MMEIQRKIGKVRESEAGRTGSTSSSSRIVVVLVLVALLLLLLVLLRKAFGKVREESLILPHHIARYTVFGVDSWYGFLLSRGHEYYGLIVIL